MDYFIDVFIESSVGFALIIAGSIFLIWCIGWSCFFGVIKLIGLLRKNKKINQGKRYKHSKHRV